MGEAKRRSKKQAERFKFSAALKRERFDLFALGARLSLARLMSVEMSHWSDLEERVIGVVFMDTTDKDYGWILMARDKIGRFRSVDVGINAKSEHLAICQLRERIAAAVDTGDFLALGDQGDETNAPTDVLAVSADFDRDQLHPHFKILLNEPGRHPGRSVFREIGPWLAPTDPHFVTEFQTKHFDQRLWEMFLWASFRELGYDVAQPEAPDFFCSAPGMAFTVEATTVGPSTSGVLADHPNPQTEEEMKKFLSDYMPMKFGSALTSKLRKVDRHGRNYWERGNAPDKPFLIAVADFHISGSVNDVGSMTYTASALWPYLYGHRVDWELVDGVLETKAVKIPDHVFKDKVVETGFFDLPGTENIAAVLFSNAGTLAKFDRIGISAGFIPEDYRYFRAGFKLNPDPNAPRPIQFGEEIGHSDYVEHWSDELQVFHNPKAKIPLPEDAFSGVTQHFFRDGKQVTITPSDVVIASRTMILGAKREAVN